MFPALRYFLLFTALILLPVLNPSTATATPFQINNGISGSWFDPSHDGEGYLVEILDDSTSLVYWFTYDLEGNQAWFIGIGEISGNTIEIDELLRFTGGEFGPDFDPATVESETWGTLTLTFSDCNTGVADYNGPPDFGSGQLQLTRLAGIHGQDCEAASVISYDSTINGAMSGSWFDSTHEGEGFILEVLDPDTALAYWFTYDGQGNQAWMVAIGSIRGNNIEFEEVLQFEGATFGQAFNPDDVVQRQWGSMRFAFATCNSGRMSYESDVGLGASNLALQRLSALQNTACNGHTLSVEAKAASSSAVDGDVNDPNNSIVENNDRAQPIPNPMILGGFATKDATSESGDHFEEDADELDHYFLDMATGQVITLYVADHPGGEADEPDFDIYLYETSDLENPVARSITLTDVEQVEVPDNGEYLIQVHAYQGGGNYTLVIDPPGAAGAAAKSAMQQPNFVPGEIIVRMESAKGLLAEHAALKEVTEHYGARIRDWVPNAPTLLELPGINQIKANFVEHKRRLKALPEPGTVAALKSETLQVAKALSQTPGIAYAEPNYLISQAAVPSDPFYARQWHYPQIALPAAWNLARGNGVVVAVIDSGAVGHPDLVPNIIEGYDFVANATAAGDGDGRDPNPTDPGHCPRGLASCTFHGTHVAATVAGAWNDIGVVGVAPSSSLVILRALGIEGNGTLFDIANAIRYAAGLDNVSPRRRSTPVDIINLSLSTPGFFAPFAETVAEALDEGVIIVSAAGNDGRNEPTMPGRFPGVINVSATDHNNNKAAYSNYGSTIDVAAPGGDLAAGFGVVSAGAFFEDSVLQAGVESQQGTSMAAPHVAGVIALMKSIYPELTLGDVERLLAAGRLTDDLAGNGARQRDDFFGYGLIDAFKAVLEAGDLSGDGVMAPIINARPMSLEFGSQQESTQIEITNGGGGTLAIDSVEGTAPWLSVTPVSTDTNGLGTYRVSVNRTGLIATDYRAEIAIRSTSAEDVKLPVRVSVVEFSEPPYAGFNYVVLIDPETGLSVGSRALRFREGEYRATVEDVLDGGYTLVAGSDFDNDFFICDEGESCGGFPSLGDLSVINVRGRDRDTAGFTISYFVPETTKSKDNARMEQAIRSRGFSR